jgi:ribosome recycling factor
MPTGNFDINELKRRMQGATQALKHELGGLRTGRAAASMLEPVQVDAYGTHMPLNQLATISVPEPRLLSVQVWDRSMVKAVEKAIVDSNLGLSPATEGQVLRLRIPALKEERRKEPTNMPKPRAWRSGTSAATASIRSRNSRRITKFPRTIRSVWPVMCRRRLTLPFRRSISCLRPRKRKSSPFRD